MKTRTKILTEVALWIAMSGLAVFTATTVQAAEPTAQENAAMFGVGLIRQEVFCDNMPTKPSTKWVREGLKAANEKLFDASHISAASTKVEALILIEGMPAFCNMINKVVTDQEAALRVSNPTLFAGFDNVGFAPAPVAAPAPAPAQVAKAKPKYELTLGRLTTSKMGSYNRVQQLVTVQNNTDETVQARINCGFFSKDELSETGISYVSSIPPGGKGHGSVTAMGINMPKIDTSSCRIDDID